MVVIIIFWQFGVELLIVLAIDGVRHEKFVLGTNLEKRHLEDVLHAQKMSGLKK